MSSERDSWLEWASQNLALGVGESKVLEEIERGGFSAVEARSLVGEVLASPMHAAARRVGADLRKWMSLSDALMELRAQAFDVTSVPRVSGLSSEAFHRDYYALNRPVILEDVAADWPALTKWDTAYLRDRFGDHTVAYQQGRSAADHRDSFIDHTREAPFRVYLDLIDRSETTNDYYLIAHDRMLDRPGFRPLLDDIIFDERYLDPGDTQGRVFFWLGPAGAATPMHRDLGNVYLAQIRGRKAIKLAPSLQMHRIYNELGYHSEADFEDLEAGDYPMLDKAQIAEVVIEPGEMLFIPLGWWHHVKALDQTITITGNNFRFGNAFTAIF